MTTDPQLSATEDAVRRIRLLSRPLTILLWIGLGLIVLVQIPEIIAILFFFHHTDALRAYVSFTDIGLGLTIAEPQLHNPSLVPLDTITIGHRVVLAGLGALCAASSALVLLQLRGLFALYSRCIVFAMENATRLKKAALWLVVAAIATNLSGRIFVLITGGPRQGIANAASALIFGAMSYVVGRVMELGREADLERKDFI